MSNNLKVIKRMVITCLGGVILTVAVVCLILSGRNDHELDLRTDVPNGENNQNSVRENPQNIDTDLNLNYMIYNGAKKILQSGAKKANLSVGGETPKATKLSEKDYDGTKENTELIRYPFTDIEIKNPRAFKIMRKDTNDYYFLEDKIGFGEIEVIILEVTLYNKESMSAFVQEEMIIFATSDSIYSCLTNGGQYHYDDNAVLYAMTYDFSPHKYLDGLDVVKTTEKKSICVTISLNGQVSDLTIQDEIHFYGNNEVLASYSYVEGTFYEKQVTEIFQIEDLFLYTYLTMDLKIANIESYENGLLITVEPVEGYKILEVLITNTAFIDDENTFEIGDVITIGYSLPYEAYDPKRVQANEVIKK